MSEKTTIIGYWGFIPAKIAKKRLDSIDKKMDINDDKMDEIINRTENEKDIIDEMAQKTDKESQKEWNKEYKKDIKLAKRLDKSWDALNEKRVAWSKIIYKPVNQLVAKRLRLEKELSNLNCIKEKIEQQQSDIKNEIVNTNRLDIKNDKKTELTKLQKNLDNIMKQISKLETKLDKIMQKINCMQEIVEAEYDMEAEYYKQLELDDNEHENQQHKSPQKPIVDSKPAPQKPIIKTQPKKSEPQNGTTPKKVKDEKKENKESKESKVKKVKEFLQKKITSARDFLKNLFSKKKVSSLGDGGNKKSEENDSKIKNENDKEENDSFDKKRKDFKEGLNPGVDVNIPSNQSKDKEDKGISNDTKNEENEIEVE